jgi:integrase
MSSRPDHLGAIAELMYETGLRVSDAILFEVDRVRVDQDGWGEYTTKQRKNGKPVTVGIPPELMKKLLALPRISARYVFYDGHTNLESYNTGQIWRLMQEVGNAIDMPGVRPHRFRDSFAVNRLNEGMLIQDVSKLLGHASVQTTERYYSPFVKSRRDATMARRKDAHTGAKTTPNKPAAVVPIRKHS